MNRKLSLIAITLLTFVVLIISCNKEKFESPENRDISSMSSEQIGTEVQSVLQSFFNAQYSFLTGKSEDKELSGYMESFSDKTLLSRISYFKTELEKIDFKYTAFTSRVIINKESIVKKENIIYFDIIDKFTLTTNDRNPDLPDEFIVSEGEYEYHIVMKFLQGTWVLTNILDKGEDPWYININPATGQLEKNEVIRDNELKNRAGYSYNATKARDYAYKYWSQPNPAYCDFTSGGGDCTNFLSQCLKQGGWTTNSSWWATGSKCCDQFGCFSTCYKCSWTVAKEFYKYVLTSGRIFDACYTDDQLNVGDIIQFQLGCGSVCHSSLVTKKYPSHEVHLGNTLNVLLRG